MAKQTFVYIGAYDDVASAKLDFAVLKELRQDDIVHLYDMAVVTNDAQGHAEIVERSQKSMQHGMEGGALVGAVIGLLPGAIIGGAVGALGGHKRKGFSADDVKKLGGALRGGQAALVAVGDDQLTRIVESTMARATLRAQGALDADVEELANELAGAAR